MIKTKDLASRQSRDQKKLQRHQRKKSRTFATKTFEELTPAEEKNVLKELAIQAGLVKDSDNI